MANQDKLKNLLNYTTSLSSATTPASTTTDAGQAPRRKLDASMLDAIMGPDDATLMLQSMAAIHDAALPPEQHEIAFQNLEALVEQIDNAKNLKNLKLWDPLSRLLDHPDAAFRRSAYAVVATALQNNPVSQGDFCALGGVERLSGRLASERDPPAFKKLVFALTCALRNHADNLARFASIDGFRALAGLLATAAADSDPADTAARETAVVDLAVAKRIVFFLGTLYRHPGADEESEGEAPAAASIVPVADRAAFVPLLVRLLARPGVGEDEDLAEKVLLALLASLRDTEVMAAAAGALTPDERARARGHATALRRRYGEDMCPFDELDRLLQ